MYSCPYHDHIGINQKEKKLLTESQRLWKKLFIPSEWDAWVFTTKLFHALSQWLQLPSPYLPARAFWQAGLGTVAWSSAGLGPRTVPGCAALPCVFLWNLAPSSVQRKHVRLWNISHCISLWSPWTKFALFIMFWWQEQLLSAAIAMKHPNRVPERKEIWLDSAQGSKVDECSLMNYPVLAEQRVPVPKRWVKGRSGELSDTMVSPSWVCAWQCLPGDQEVAVFLCHRTLPAAASSFPELSDRRAFWLHRNILFIITSKNIMTGD